MEYYEKAASLGNTVSLFNLGCMYERGNGVEQDNKKAIEYFEKASDARDYDAMAELGYLYIAGEGIDPDYMLALTYLDSAADGGNTSAMLNAGYLYERGEGGIPLDYEKALEYYERAADAGDPDAAEYIKAVKELMGENGQAEAAGDQTGSVSSETDGNSTGYTEEAADWQPEYFRYGDYECYTNADGTVTISKWRGAGKQRLVPQKINGKTVSTIGPGAFRGCSRLTSIKIPSTVESIAPDAFDECPAVLIVTRGSYAEQYADENKLEKEYSSDSEVSRDVEMVRKVQEKLNAKGFDCGVPDGDFGPKTQAALDSYQRRNGLNIRAEITAEVLDSLGIAH